MYKNVYNIENYQQKVLRSEKFGYFVHMLEPFFLSIPYHSDLCLLL